MKPIFLAVLLISTNFSCMESQNKTKNKSKVGGNCEGCEAIYEYADNPITFSDTILGFNKLGTPIKISGRVLKKDKKTPAANVILYIYHTDDKGRYPTDSNSKGWELRHGYLRAWLKQTLMDTMSFTLLDQLHIQIQPHHNISI